MSAARLLMDRAILVRALTGNVPSPCQSVCRMDADLVLCEGCWRTLDEIRRWSSCSEGEKKEVWALIEQRVAATTP